MILVDSNVMIDLLTDDPIWADWSQQQLHAAIRADELAINDVVYAEISVRYRRRAELDVFLDRIRVGLVAIPRAALFLAGKAFERYRASGGLKTGVLPDFFVGAHAAFTAAPLITRDTRRFRSYFPTISLITPNLN